MKSPLRPTLQPPPAIVSPPKYLENSVIQTIRRVVDQLVSFTSFESDLRTVSAEQRTLLKGQMLAQAELKPFVRKQQFVRDVWQFILGEFWKAICKRGQQVFQAVHTAGGPTGWGGNPLARCASTNRRPCGAIGACG